MDAPRHSAEAALDALIDRLHRRGRLRVWSLIVTVFGDAIAPRGGRVSLAVLQEIMGRLRIEPGAVRTALSRLAADHWVTRERHGRNSFYRLADEGRHAFDLATRRIYAAAPPAWDGAWTVAIAPPGGGEPAEALREAGFLRIADGVHLRPGTVGAGQSAGVLSGMLVIHGESAEHPEMLRRLWPSAELGEAYLTLASAFAPLAEALGQGDSLSPLDAMAARTLLIHDWRRIVLRDPGLPEALLPEGWPGETARALVRNCYAKLLPASEAWLDDSRLPPPAANLAARFAGVAQSSR